MKKLLTVFVTALFFMVFLAVCFLTTTYAQNWTQVNTDGFGNPFMEDARCMVVYKDKLYVGTATEALGETCEVWQYNDSTWVQVNTDGFVDVDNIGILCLVVYNNFLYAGVENNVTGCEVWRTAAIGGPPFTDWEQVNTDGFGDVNNELIGGMVVFNENLYMGTLNEITGCEIWRTAAVGGPLFTDWKQVNTNGFGDFNNGEAEDLTTYNGILYVGTDNETTGCEIWGTTAVGGPPFADWEQVNTDGFGDVNNSEAESLTTYNSNLYVGVGNGTTGCEIWRTAAVGGPPFTDWEQVNTNGFGDVNNTETFGIIVFNDYLYIGTENETTGGEVWGTAAVGGPPFTDWEQKNDDGFGDVNNVGAVLGFVYNNQLYAGTSNSSTGCEVWSFTTTDDDGSDDSGDDGNGGDDDSDDDSCFIATAAFGSLMEPHVKLLRKFRDRFLLTNVVGKTFVDLYYTYSPPLADYIANHDILRMMVRMSLLPLVGVSYSMLNFGPVITFTMLMVLLTIPILLISFYRRKTRAIQ